MKCHYDVMGVPRDASFEEIKKQYKKLALVWHPDRNFGREELATQTFKEISTAYSVLNDPQERKWYDDHRESILRGRDGTRGEDGDEEDEDNVANQLNIWHYFNPTCFNKFNDDPDGFYTVYRGIFDEISDKEFESQTSSKSSRTKHNSQYPSFGSSVSAPEEVLSFYACWENFIYYLTFSYVDKYNPLEAPNRDVRRAMEKENSKLRDKERKDYIALIKSLIAYVKKRDERYIQIVSDKQKAKEEETKRKTEQKAIEKEKKKELKEQWKLQQEQEEETRAKEREGVFLLADNDSEDEEPEEEQEEGMTTSSKKRRSGKKSKKRGGGVWNDNIRMVNEHQEEVDAENDMELYAQIKKMNLKKNNTTTEESVPSQNDSPRLDTESTPVPSEGTNQADLNQEQGEDGEQDEEDGEEEEVLFSCDICSKHFKSEAQLNQHLNSKPHRMKVKESQKQSKKKA
jgi:DnaJ family protein A protein 5